MKSIKSYAGLGGGFGGGEYKMKFTGTRDEAEKAAWDAAVEDYDSYEGSQGIRSVEEIMEEDGLDREDAEETKIFEAHGANFWQVDRPVTEGWLEVSGPLAEKVRAMIEAVGLETTRDEDHEIMFTDLEPPEEGILMEKEFLYEKTHFLYVAVACLEDDYWQLSITVAREVWSDEIDELVKLHLRCDDLPGLRKAVEGPLTTLAGRMSEIQKGYNDLHGQCAALGEGIRTEG